MSSDVTARPAGRMSIGEVVRRLREDFPDVSISKIRFLEVEGLVEPSRSPSGYRKFSHADVDRLRYVLAAQRDHYLPLRVIKEHLDAIARGLEPPSIAGASPRVPLSPSVDGTEPTTPRSDIRLSRDELLANTGLNDQQLTDLQQYGLVRVSGGSEQFDRAALTIASTAASLAQHGLEPRHLRTFKTAADRAAGLIEQVTPPVPRRGEEGGRARAETIRVELTALAVQLHEALVRLALTPPE